MIEDRWYCVGNLKKIEKHIIYVHDLHVYGFIDTHKLDVSI